MKRRTSRYILNDINQDVESPVDFCVGEVRWAAMCDLVSLNCRKTAFDFSVIFQAKEIQL